MAESDAPLESLDAGPGEPWVERKRGKEKKEKRRAYALVLGDSGPERAVSPSVAIVIKRRRRKKEKDSSYDRAGDLRAQSRSSNDRKRGGKMGLSIAKARERASASRLWRRKRKRRKRGREGGGAPSYPASLGKEA